MPHLCFEFEVADKDSAAAEELKAKSYVLLHKAKSYVLLHGVRTELWETVAASPRERRLRKCVVSSGVHLATS
jgi:hypothetical protein